MRQFRGSSIALDVGDGDDKRIVEELHRSELENVQGDLAVLQIVLIPAVVESPLRPGQPDRGHKLQLEPGLAEMMRQWSVIVIGRL